MNDIPSASQMYRHANCPGNRILIRSLKERGLLTEEAQSEDATVGQRIHAALQGLEEPLTLSETEVKDDCHYLAEQCAHQLFGTQKLELVVEERFNYEIEKTTMFTGKPDRYYLSGRDGLDINFKTGRKGSPDSHLNLQLRSEVVLLYHNFGSERIYAAIIEPLVSSKPEIAVYEQADIIKAEAEILGIVDRTNFVTDRTAGAWCIHCPARAFCPEARKLADLEPLRIYTPELPKGTEGAKRIETLYLAKKIIDAQLEYYRGLVRTEFGSIPGWHISAGKEVRSIDVGAILLIAESLGVADEVKGLVNETLSITKLEELMSKHWNLKGKSFDKKFSRTFRDAIKTVTTKGSLQKIPKRLLN